MVRQGELRSSAVAQVLLRMPQVLRGSAAAIAEVQQIVARAPVRIVPALDRAMRDARLHQALGLSFLDVRPGEWTRVTQLAESASGVLGVLSLVRSGHTREAATRLLGGIVDRLATAFLINRLNDYVRGIAELAWVGLERRLSPRHAEPLVACLPLVDRMESWIRATDTSRERLRGLLRSEDPRCRAALWAGTRAADREVARAACGLLVEVLLGRPEIREVLVAALAIRDQKTRGWAAALASDPQITPPEVFAALAPALAADPAPHVRLAGLHGRARQGDHAGILRAAFDTNAEVRHQARVLLAASSGAIDYRGRALAMLAEGDDRGAMLAALATLSDFGRGEDIAQIEPFAADGRPSVAREAARTLAILRRL